MKKIRRLSLVAAMILCLNYVAQSTPTNTKCDRSCSGKYQTHARADTTPDTNFMNTEKVISCKLTTPELRIRKNRVIAALKLKVKEKQEMPDGYKYRFA